MEAEQPHTPLPIQRKGTAIRNRRTPGLCIHTCPTAEPAIPAKHQPASTMLFSCEAEEGLFEPVPADVGLLLALTA